MGVKDGGGEWGEALDVMGLKPAGSSVRLGSSGLGPGGSGDKRVGHQPVLCLPSLCHSQEQRSRFLAYEVLVMAEVGSERRHSRAWFMKGFVSQADGTEL